MDYPLPENDLSVSLVKSTLGESSNNIGTLCKSSKINIWSKRKPVRDTRIFVPSDEVGKGSDGMYGLSLPKWEGDDTLLTLYNRPRGNAALQHYPYMPEPYRLGDFRGYFDLRDLPIKLLPKPDSITIGNEEGTGSLQADYVYEHPSFGSPVVSIFDLPLRLCAFYYLHDSHFIGWSPSLYYNLGDAPVMNLDIKFGLISSAQAASLNNWYTQLPSSDINIYELPREYTTQNKNWINVPTVLASHIIRNWNVLRRYDLNKLEYSISAGYSFGATIVIKEQESDTTAYQFNVSVTADEITSGYKSLDTLPLLQDKNYVAYLYDGNILKGYRSI